MSTRNLIIMLGVAASLFGGMSLLFRPAGNSETPALDTPEQVNQTHSQTNDSVIISSDSLDKLPEKQDTAPSLSKKTIASQKTPATLTLSDINYATKRGSTTVLVLVDGSEFIVTPNTYQQLPGNIKVRLEVNYDR
jgi:hypothetical protein